jgi:hypothetical protein
MRIFRAIGAHPALNRAFRRATFPICGSDRRRGGELSLFHVMDGLVHISPLQKENCLCYSPVVPEK